VIEVAADARDLAVAKLDDDPKLRIDRHAAALPMPLQATKYQDTVAEIARLRHGHMEITPGVTGLREIPFDPFASPVTLTSD